MPTGQNTLAVEDTHTCGPDADALVRWLASDDLRAADGHCASWWNPAHPGYPYPEITGLLLHYLATSGVAANRSKHLAHALWQHGVGACGGVQRGDVAYTFDTAMALRGVLAYARRAGDQDGRWHDLASSWTRLLVRAVLDGNAVLGAGQPVLDAGTRWSLAFGAHQAKALGALHDSGRDLGLEPELTTATAVLLALVESLVEPDGRIRIHARSGVTYTHSHCYALEGMIMATPDGQPWRESVLAGAGWLAAAQRTTGELLAWHDGVGPVGPDRTDATAQAVRIWLLVDRERYWREITLARSFLVNNIVLPRGVRYGSSSDDLSSWATIFTAQALDWIRRPDRASASALV